MVAEAPGKDMVARINLSGSAASPKLTLSSEPPFPSDEILTRLLFGRSVADITPMQAVQLAAAATTLAGGDSSFDIMDRARKFLFVDQLEVKQAEGLDKQTTVSAGKYLREGVYLEVEKGVGPESGKSSVQVDIPPNLTLETEVGENAQGGVGLNWKLHY
jgi:translocation and assembly module TamB